MIARTIATLSVTFPHVKCHDCLLAAQAGPTISPGEGLEIGPKATSGTVLDVADPPPLPMEELPKLQYCQKKACFHSVHSWLLFSNLANESVAMALVVAVVCWVDNGSVTFFV
jgi:hypothetical protein